MLNLRFVLRYNISIIFNLQIILYSIYIIYNKPVNQNLTSISVAAMKQASIYIYTHTTARVILESPMLNRNVLLRIHSTKKAKHKIHKIVYLNTVRTRNSLRGFLKSKLVN